MTDLLSTISNFWSSLIHAATHAANSMVLGCDAPSSIGAPGGNHKSSFTLSKTAPTLPLSCSGTLIAKNKLLVPTVCVEQFKQDRSMPIAGVMDGLPHLRSFNVSTSINDTQQLPHSNGLLTLLRMNEGNWQNGLPIDSNFKKRSSEIMSPFPLECTNPSLNTSGKTAVPPRRMDQAVASWPKLHVTEVARPETFWRKSSSLFKAQWQKDDLPPNGTPFINEQGNLLGIHVPNDKEQTLAFAPIPSDLCPK